MKFTEEYKQEIRREFNDLTSNKEQWYYIYELIYQNYYTYFDIQRIFNISFDQSVEAFRQLNIRLCARTKCWNGERLQKRENFGRNKSSPDGLENQCKTCKKHISKETAKKNREKEKPLIEFKKCGNSDCPHGNVLQPVENFYKSSIKKDGFDNYCKDCQKINTKRIRKNNKKQNQNRGKSFINYKKCGNSDCPHGNVLQPVENFYISNLNSDGFTAQCKECVRNFNKVISESFAYYETHYSKLGAYEEVREDLYNSNLLQVKCANCHSWFNPTNRQAHNRYNSIIGQDSGDNHFYCSDGCKKSCPVYRQNYYRKDNSNYIELNREVQSELRNLVLKRDNYTCIKCGNTNNLHCHHVEGIHWEPIESADVDKCITVCENCHKKIHNIPGCTYQDMQCANY